MAYRPEDNTEGMAVLVGGIISLTPAFADYTQRQLLHLHLSVNQCWTCVTCSCNCRKQGVMSEQLFAFPTELFD